MRILIAVHTYFPDKNGVQMVTQYIAEGLAKNNDVFIITSKDDNLDNEDIINDVYIRRIKVSKRGYWFFGERKEYLQYIKALNADVFICVCTQTWTFDWIINNLNEIPAKKVLYTHGYSGLLDEYPIITDILHFRMRAFIYHLYWRQYYSKAYKYIEKFELVTYLSEHNNSMRYAQKHNLKNGIIMENAVEDVFFQHPVTDRIKSDSSVSYIYIANYDDNKNHQLVLEAFYLTNHNNIELILAGNGEREYYEKLVLLKSKLDQESGHRNIRLIYGQDRSDTYRLYDNADVFVCSSKKEQFPIMLCEAAAKGLAIISTNVGHASLMQGILIANTKEEISSEIEKLYYHPQLRIELGLKLRDYALKHYRRQEKIKYFEKELEKLW